MPNMESRNEERNSSQPPGGDKSIQNRGHLDEKEFNWPAFAVAVSFALLIVCLSLIFYSFNLSSTISDQKNIIREKESRISQLTSELQDKKKMLAILARPGLRVTHLSGLEINPDGYGTVFWDPGKREALLQVSNLPPVSASRLYKLWLFKNGKPIGAGSFSVEDRSSVFRLIEEMPDVTKEPVEGFAVSLEPHKNTQIPAGDFYLMSKKE